MKYKLILILFLASVTFINGQDQEKKSRKEIKEEKIAKQKETVKNLIEEKTFVFDARTAFSATVGNINTSYPYNVKLVKDSIYSFLPYYGRSYNVEFGSAESPMVFDLPINELEIIKKTKKGYQVNVKVKKGMDIINFSFSISETGSATLTVISTNRQVITYYGDITVKNEKDNI